MGCHFSGLGLKKSVRFCFLSPQIGLGLKNLRGTPLSKIRTSASPGSVDSAIVSLGQLSSDGRLDEGLGRIKCFPSVSVSRFLPVLPILEALQYTVHRSS